MKSTKAMTTEEKETMLKIVVPNMPDIPPGPIPRRELPLDKTSMSYWFPLIETAGLPVPKTKFVEMTDTGRRLIWDVFDGKWSDDFHNDPFFVKMAEAAKETGYPCFMRSDHTSNKHSWKDTCYLESESLIPAHVLSIVEFSECVWIPWDTWAVRELLSTIPYGVCPRYDDFPVCKEFRFFVDDGKVRCWHPYWPKEALVDGEWEVDADNDTAYTDLCDLDDETLTYLKSLAIRAGEACGGSWSIDFLETEYGWYLTDMAEAHKSFHWEGCKHHGA